MNMLELFKIHKKYPLMLPQNDFTIWNGVLNFKEEPVALTISVPKYPSLSGISVIVHNNVHVRMVANKFNKSVQDLGVGVNHYADHPFVGRSSKGDSINIYEQVISEIKDFGAENVFECSGDLTTIKLLVTDDREEEHYLLLNLPDDYPLSPVIVVNVDLPDSVISQISQASTVKDAFINFQSVINSLQDFWSAYEMLQQKTWIVDPEHPKKKDTYCRIVINDSISMLLTLNPLQVSSCPDLKFLGPDNAVLPLRATVEENLKEYGWDEDQSIYSNLLLILGLDVFPQRTEEEVISGVLFQPSECCICFTLRLEDDLLPTKICNNPKCSSLYHLTCLSQWFQAVPTNEPSFNLISGECPCCGERILCPLQLL